ADAARGAGAVPQRQRGQHPRCQRRLPEGAIMNRGFPTLRPRRLRAHPLLRDLVRETTLSVSDLIFPLFVRHGQGVRKEISSMPGNYQLSTDTLVEEVGRAFDQGVRAFILFGIPAHKDPTGSSAWAEDGIVAQALRVLKQQFRDRILLMTDE